MKQKPLVGISDNYGEEGWHNLKVEYVSALAAAGNQYSRPAGRACGDTARALYLTASDESVLVADLDGYRNLGIVNVDLYSGVIFENNAADLVADLR